MANSLAELLQSGRFAITTEAEPAEGDECRADAGAGRSRCAGAVDAFNLTDSHTARMSMSPIAAARLLLDRGLEPILQMTCRDRNRIALQADTLAAAALGVRNIVTMTGDQSGRRRPSRRQACVRHRLHCPAANARGACADGQGYVRRGVARLAGLVRRRGGEPGRGRPRPRNRAYGREDCGRRGVLSDASGV